MTALAGQLSFDGRPAAPDVGRMLRAQQHYGQADRIWSDGAIGLGRRLFALLPEDKLDHGPQIGGAGTITLVADVRLDNRAELASALGLPTAEEPRLCDSALVLKCIEAWGTAAVQRLRGDFALAWWDARRRQLVLARDFLGRRPLHFHRGRDFFAFASMPKGLHALPEIPLGPDADALAGFIALLPDDGRSTMFAGVSKVTGGELVTVTADGIWAERYWSPPTARLRLADERGYDEAIREALDRAVADRLRGAGGAVSAHLSAGLDSSAVAATAARLLGSDGTVTAYTAVPRPGYERGCNGRITDEAELSGKVAALYPNMEQRLVPASGRSPFERLDQYYHLFDQPVRNLCNFVWMTAIGERMRERGSNVLLTGQYGNFTISYDGLAALSEMIRQGRFPALARTVAALLRNGTRTGTVAAQILAPVVPNALWNAVRRLRGTGRRFSGSCISEDRSAWAARAAAERGFDLGYRPRADSVALRLSGFRRSDPGNYAKGMLAGWGVDIRDPLADQRLVELCLSIPTEQFLGGRVPRGLARRALADRLPAEVRAERRKGYQAADWHEAMRVGLPQARQEIDRLCEVDLAGDLLDTARMRALARDVPEAGWDREQRMRDYRLALLRGVSVGHFVRRASGSNA